MPVTHVVFIYSAAVGCVPLSASLLSPWLPVEDLKLWIKLEKSSLGLGGQGKEEQSLHFFSTPNLKSLETGWRVRLRSWFLMGNVALLMRFWFIGNIAYLWILFQVIMEESGGE